MPDIKGGFEKNGADGGDIYLPRDICNLSLNNAVDICMWRSIYDIAANNNDDDDPYVWRDIYDPSLNYICDSDEDEYSYRMNSSVGFG